MPEFTTEIDIDPSEFIDSCSTREREKLIEILEEEGYINTKEFDHGVKRPNVNDQIFWASLDKLGKCRDLLTLEEETYINSLAEKFKHLR